MSDVRPKKTPPRIPPWPKGPFPERYRFEAIEGRLEGAWDARNVDGVPVRSALATWGLEPLDGHADRWVELVVPRDGTLTDEARARLEQHGCLAFAWTASSRARAEAEREGRDPWRVAGRDVFAVVPTLDPVDAIGALGVAGPIHGIGLSAIVRFAVTLRTFGTYAIARAGEDHLRLAFTARDERVFLRIADRMREICPALRRAYAEPDPLAEVLRGAGELELDWR